MQSLAFLWFQLQMTKQYLDEKTFGPAPSPANSANLNTPIVAGTVRRASVKQASRMAPAKQGPRNERWRISPPRAQAATILIQQPERR
jgi:hypothetical protein